MNDIDRTMQSLMAAYRHDMNEAQEAHDRVVESLISTLKSELERQRSKASTADREVTRLTKQQEELRTESGLLRKTIEKLVGVIDSLKLELAAEREAHTKLRDATARQRHIIVLDDLGNVSRCSCGLTFTDSGEALAHEAEMNG